MSDSASRLNVAASAVSVGIMAIGLLLAWSLGREFITHAEVLFDYLKSTTGEPVSSDPELNEYLEPYTDDSRYLTQILNDNRLSLAKAHRRDTIQLLGTSLDNDTPTFSENGNLPDTVREYLSDRLALVAEEFDPTQKETWSDMVHQVQLSLGRRSPRDFQRARLRAEAYLDSHKLPAALANARNIFDSYGGGPYASESEFFVGSDPDPNAFDYLILSEPSNSATDGPEMTFQLVAPRGGQIGQVHVRTAEVFANVRLLRAWFPTNLIDDGIPMPVEMRIRYFGRKGGLRVVPSFLVVFLGLDTIINLDAPEELGRLEQAITSNDCCELVSKGLSLSLAPSSVRKVGELKYRARTAPDDPRVVALISERRLH